MVMRWWPALIVVAACGERRAAPDVPMENAPPAPTGGCTVAVDRRGTIAIDGVILPDFEPETLRRVLGEPDRVEKLEHTEFYEEFGDDGAGWSSDEVPVTDFHHVYDARGLVFATRNGAFGESDHPELMRIFFASPRLFDNTEAPEVVPVTRGVCRLELGGVLVDPDVDARPPGVDYRTDQFPLWGTDFGSTSIATVIDRVYTVDGAPYLMVFLDAPATGRPSYAELILR